MDDLRERTAFVGNLHPEVTNDILRQIAIQVILTMSNNTYS